MEPTLQTSSLVVADNNEEISIFDDLKPLPVYYSERAIYVFSILFSTLFGAILMAINLKNSEKKKGTWQVVTFGLIYTIGISWGLSYAPKSSTGLSIGLNAIGAYVLRQFFWIKYIGKDVNYTKRSVLIPAIVGIFIALLVIVAVIYASGLLN